MKRGCDRAATPSCLFSGTHTLLWQKVCIASLPQDRRQESFQRPMSIPKLNSVAQKCSNRYLREDWLPKNGKKSLAKFPASFSDCQWSWIQHGIRPYGWLLFPRFFGMIIWDSANAQPKQPVASYRKKVVVLMPVIRMYFTYLISQIWITMDMSIMTDYLVQNYLLYLKALCIYLAIFFNLSIHFYLSLHFWTTIFFSLVDMIAFLLYFF